MILLIFPNLSPFPCHAMTPLAVFTVGTYLEKRGIGGTFSRERYVESFKSRVLLRVENGFGRVVSGMFTNRLV